MELKASIILLLINLYFVSLTSCKVLIFTFAYNHPDFIELQHKLFQKFLKDEYEFVVFDDSKDNNITNEINLVCQKNNIKHVKIRKRYMTDLTSIAFQSHGGSVNTMPPR